MYDGDSQSAHQAVGAARHSTSHRSVSRLFVTRADCAANSGILWQLWFCSVVRLTNSSPHALHADGGNKTTERPSVRVVNPCRKAPSVELTQTYNAMTAASRKHHSLRLLCEYHLLTLWTIPSMCKSDGRSMPRHESITTSPRRRPQVKRRWFLSRAHRIPTGSTQRTNPILVTDGWPEHTFTTCTHYMSQSHRQLPAALWPRGALHCFPIAHMSGGSSSDWWDSWEWRGEWLDSSSPEPAPTVQVTDDQVMNTVHKLQDRLQKMLAATQRRSHKTETERATSTAKGNAAYAAMEAVIMNGLKGSKPNHTTIGTSVFCRLTQKKGPCGMTVNSDMMTIALQKTR